MRRESSQGHFASQTKGAKAVGAASSCKARAQTQRPNCNWRSRSAAQQLQKGALSEALLKARDTLYFFFLFLDGQPKRCGQSSGKFKETIYLSWWIFQVYDCLVEGRFVFFGGKHHFLMDSTSRFFIQPFLIPSPNSS